MLVGIDIGGTFTDLVAILDGNMVSLKVPSTPDDPAQGALKGLSRLLEKLECGADGISLLAHGTTIATNALIERKGALAGLITTHGFRDILEIGRLSKPIGQMYNIQYEKPPQLIPRRLRFEVDERVAADGSILHDLDRKSVENAIEGLTQAGVNSVAVCFLFSYLRPEHEQAVVNILRERHPELTVYASSDILPEIREYERMSLTAVNAYVGPVVAKYLREMEKQVEALGSHEPLHIMQSNGGLTTTDNAVSKPALLVLSGPAGGVTSAQYIGRQTNFPNLVSLDMGGTSTDVAVIVGGDPIRTTDRQVFGSPLVFPMLDIETIGAGGGSIAWLDSGNALHVGPESAGADPGPAAYGRGGTNPTVTDADLVLGYLNPDFLLEGDMPIHLTLAKQALEEKVARPLGLTVVEAAAGIYHIVNSTMANAVRLKTISAGHDPRDFALVAFGGAGPVHGVEVARQIDIPWVIVPPYPGVTSALGVAVADIVHDYVQTYMVKLNQIDFADLNRVIEAMVARSQNDLNADGLPEERRRIECTADLRYVGQGFSLNIPLPTGQLDAKAIEALSQSFHQTHEAVYGFKAEHEPIELVNVRVKATGLSSYTPPSSTESRPLVTRKRQGTQTRPAYFNDFRDFVDTVIFHRSDLHPGDVIEGPTIVEQHDSTVVVPPKWFGVVDHYGHLILGEEVYGFERR